MNMIDPVTQIARVAHEANRAKDYLFYGVVAALIQAGR